jgi:tetratricopeptide (TPR) repeat protein
VGARADRHVARAAERGGRPPGRGGGAPRRADPGARGPRPCERIVDFGLRAEHARALRADGRPGEALRQIAECVRADPLNSDARREAGRIHHSLGQYGEALESWKHALWLAPNDAYLHFDVALCLRRVAQNVGGGGATLARAAEHLDKALQLFDGEDPVGAAWARVWGGRVALERGRLGESVALLTGALDGPAGAVAALFLGEARLETGEVGLAESAFARCRAAVAPDAPEPLDHDWGDQLPSDALLCRLECGLARCRLAGPEARQPAELERAGELVRSAERHAGRLEDDRLRRDCEALCADVEARRLCAAGLIDAALAEAGRRLRLGPSPAARLLQAELLELAATGAAELDHGARLRLEADAAWDELDRHEDGQVARSGRALRARLARAAPAAGERRPPARRSASNGGARSARRRTRVPR